MTKQRTPDLSGFVDSGFDMQFFDYGCDISGIDYLFGYSDRGFAIPQNGMETDFVRPRLNKPQILTDYSKVLVDGFVWCVMSKTNHGTHLWEKMVTRNGKITKPHWNCTDLLQPAIMWLEFIGVEAGSGLEEWAKAHDVPVMEVE